ncbi:Bcl-2 family protein [Streptococcus pneumoniae]|nr:Bcl-2 family protein [Streptococcus pneumoniae]
MISKRLELVASFVSQGAILLDVGSDHAYLPIELVERGQIKSAIAGEVVEGPYQSAVKNVEAHGLKEKIQVRLANGFQLLKRLTKCLSLPLLAWVVV